MRIDIHGVLPARTSVDGVPHAPGTVEHLLVAAGALAAGPVDDLLAFAGDVPHAYRTGGRPADVSVVIASPAVG